jgi:putative FmdB family regulatory protein
MPIYEFYCEACHTIFNFFSKRINTTKRPKCPQCKTRTLTREISLFAIGGRSSEEDAMDDFPVDESKMEQAMSMLAKEAEHINEDDPRQAANLMEKLTSMTGIELGPGMQEAIQRMKDGQDPDEIEAQMGDLLESEEPFLFPAKGEKSTMRRLYPKRDDKLYDL